MKTKITIGVIGILAVVALLWINRPTETIQTVSATPTAEPTLTVESTPLPTEKPTAEPTPMPTEAPTPEPTVEPTPEVKEEAPIIEEPAVEATPAPSETPKPNVTVKTEADKQAELQAEALKRLEALGVAESPTSDRTGNTKGYHGDGTHFGDLQ